MPSQNEIRESITQQIIDALTQGTTPWRRPWRHSKNAGLPTNVSSKRRYTGVNPLILEISRIRKGLQSKWWATYRQWQQLGTHVRRGEKGTQIIFFKPIVVEKNKDANGNQVEKTIPLLRTFTVFNADQVEGMEHLRVGYGDDTDSVEPEVSFEQADELVENSGADIRFGANAFYDSRNDYIQMPHKHRFDGPTYYETLFHEMAHWTEHPTRLNVQRTDEQNAYAMGELVAEIGSCFVCTELGIPLAEGLENHAAYVSGWLKALANDHSAIFRASTQANRITDYLLAFQTSPAEKPEPAIIV